MRNGIRNIGSVIFTGFVMLAACKHKPPAPVPGTANNTDTGICFTRDILPIFSTNCARTGCHDAISTQGGFRFTDYNSIVAKDFKAGDADETKLYKKITEDKAEKRMPPPPWQALKTEQIHLIKRWIDEGAKRCE